MPRRAIYETPTHVYTPDSFVQAFNSYQTHQLAVDGMGMSSKRLSVICSRLRARGYPVRKHKGGRPAL